MSNIIKFPRIKNRNQHPGLKHSHEAITTLNDMAIQTALIVHDNLSEGSWGIKSKKQRRELIDAAHEVVRSFQKPGVLPTKEINSALERFSLATRFLPLGLAGLIIKMSKNYVRR